MHSFLDKDFNSAFYLLSVSFLPVRAVLAARMKLDMNESKRARAFASSRCVVALRSLLALPKTVRTSPRRVECGLHAEAARICNGCRSRLAVERESCDHPRQGQPWSSRVCCMNPQHWQSFETRHATIGCHGINRQQVSLKDKSRMAYLSVGE